MSVPVTEPTMIGLSERMHATLKRLKEDGHIAEMADGYRLGIALALAYGVIPEEVPAPRTTIFSVATIDPDREIGNAIKALIDTDNSSIYRMAERLAEWGVSELARQAEGGLLDIGAALLQAEQANR